jgi:hypothetical protein
MKNGDLVTLTLPHWDKKYNYFICRVREYLDHRERKKFQYLGLKRVGKRKNEYAKDIYNDTTWVFEPVDVKDVEPYKCDDSGIQCGKCDLCYFGEDFRDY